MKTSLTKKEALEKIEEFFKRKEFDAKEARKVKRLAMKFNIKLGEKRKKFCKRCLSKLGGKTRVSRVYKSIKCANCKYRNRFKL